jgi:predicted DCC family thiol-disulfide oxidoreductase YuxK
MWLISTTAPSLSLLLAAGGERLPVGWKEAEGVPAIPAILPQLKEVMRGRRAGTNCPMRRAENAWDEGVGNCHNPIQPGSWRVVLTQSLRPPANRDKAECTPSCCDCATFDASGRRRVGWLASIRAEPMPQILVIYDDACSLCSFHVRVMSWLDWLHRTRYVPASHPVASEWAVNVTREELMHAIHCVEPNGRIHRGAHCLRLIGMRIPLLVPISILLWLPGTMWVAERVYGWISRHRYGLSRLLGCKGACAAVPTRHRPEDSQGKLPEPGD